MGLPLEHFIEGPPVITERFLTIATMRYCIVANVGIAVDSKKKTYFFIPTERAVRWLEEYGFSIGPLLEEHVSMAVRSEFVRPLEAHGSGPLLTIPVFFQDRSEYEEVIQFLLREHTRIHHLNDR